MGGEYQMVLIILFIVGLLVFLGLPAWAKLVVTIANLFIPDPLPFVDEVIMIAITLADLKG